MSLQIVNLDSCVNILSGFAFKSKYFNSNQEGTPLIRIRNVVESKIETYYSGEFDDQYLIKKGDLLVGMDGDFNRQKWNNEPALLNQRVCKITPISKKINASYLYHLLPKELDRIHAVTPCVTVKHLSVQKIKDIELILPSLPEQQRIADILDKAEAINQKREQALALCDEFLRATFLNMFGDPVSNPKGWKVDKLKNLTSINPKPDKSKLQNININEGVSFVPMAAVCEVDKKVTEYERRPLNEVIKGFTYFEKEDVILAKITPCFENGKMAHLNNLPTDIGYGSTEFHVFRVSNKTIMPEYLFNMLKLEYFLEMGAFKMRGAAGQRRVPIEFFGEFVMPIPPIELQQKFSEIVEKVNAIKAHIQHAQELPLFDALSQQAFKGELTQ